MKQVFGMLLVLGELILFVIDISAQGNQLTQASIAYQFGLSCKESGKLDQALQYFLVGNEYAYRIDSNDNIIKAEIFYEIGLIYAQIAKLDSSLLYQKLGFEMKQRLFPNGNITTVKSCNSLAGLYAGVWEYERALEMRKNALTVARNLPQSEEVLLESGKLCNNIGRLYFSLHENGLAMQYYNAGLGIAEGKGGEFGPIAAMLYLNLADLHIRIEKHKESFEYIDRAKSAYGSCRVDEGAYYWQVRGDAYLAINVLDSALLCYRKNMSKVIQNINPNERNKAVAHRGQSLVFYEMNEYDSCIYHAKQVLQIEKNISPEVHSQNVEAYRIIAKCLIQQKKKDEALVYLKKSLLANNYYGDINTIVAYEQAAISFNEIAQLYYEGYGECNDLEYLLESFKHFVLADSCITLKRRFLLLPDAKEIFSNSTRQIYESAVIVSENLYRITSDKQYIIQAFYFSERCKSLNLSDSYQSNQDAINGKLPISFLEEEAALKRKISQVKYQYINQTAAVELSRDTTASTFEHDIHILNIKLDSLIKLYKDSFPNYFSARYIDYSIHIDDAILYCDENKSTILSYFFACNELFVFAISYKGIQLEVKSVPSDLDDLIKRFRGNISRIPSIFDSSEACTNRLVEISEDAFNIFRVIMPNDSITLKQRLLIIPDGQISYISFSALIDQPVMGDRVLRINEWPFLVRRHAVSYCYSVALLKQMEIKQHYKNPVGVFLGIAPDFLNKKWLSNSYDEDFIRESSLRLWFNVPEILSISKHFECTEQCHLLIGDNALKDSLMYHASNYRILHFSTHAYEYNQSNTSGSFLLLLHEPVSISFVIPLYFDEILNLNLNADMVVLNGCKTGLGRYSKTEGLIGLGQAFAYAGAKSIVVTMWSIKDTETNTILYNLFYSNLLMGIPKDISLQRAQLAFLTQVNQKSNLFIDPHYWASFTCIGDQSPLF